MDAMGVTDLYERKHFANLLQTLSGWCLQYSVVKYEFQCLQIKINSPSKKASDIYKNFVVGCYSSRDRCYHGNASVKTSAYSFHKGKTET